MLVVVLWYIYIDVINHVNNYMQGYSVQAVVYESVCTDIPVQKVVVGGPRTLCQSGHLQLLTMVDNLCACGSNWYNNIHITNVLNEYMQGYVRWYTNGYQVQKHIYCITAPYTGTYTRVLYTTVAL